MSDKNKRQKASEENKRLLSCPFCGGEAEVLEYTMHGGNKRYEVKCLNFGCGVVVYTAPKDSKEEAINAWNRRKPVDDVVEALKKPIWIEHTDDLTLNEIAETAIKQTREVAIERVKEILNE